MQTISFWSRKKRVHVCVLLRWRWEGCFYSGPVSKNLILIKHPKRTNKNYIQNKKPNKSIVEFDTETSQWKLTRMKINYPWELENRNTFDCWGFIDGSLCPVTCPSPLSPTRFQVVTYWRALIFITVPFRKRVYIYSYYRFTFHCGHFICNIMSMSNISIFFSNRLNRHEEI